MFELACSFVLSKELENREFILIVGTYARNFFGNDSSCNAGSRTLRLSSREILTDASSGNDVLQVTEILSVEVYPYTYHPR